MDIILTLDYELFLNDKTGTVQKCLEKPVFELQKVCERRAFRYTVFVDAAYLYMLEQLKKQSEDLEEDYQRVCDNIRWIKAKGHDVQLHIHPQWYYSKYSRGVWTLDWNHYRLSDMKPDEAARLFKASKDLLDEIIGEKVTIYRAGGYSLPGSDYYNLFKENGIDADSSVLPGIKEITSTHKFDYRGLPYVPYRFNDVCKPCPDGLFVELPISFAKELFITKYLSIKKRFMKDKENINWGDGGDNPVVGMANNLKKRLASFTIFKQPRATIDYQSFFFLRSTYDNSKKNGYMTIIGHPKNFSPASLNFFDSFVKDTLAAGDRFITAKEYCNQFIKEK